MVLLDSLLNTTDKIVFLIFAIVIFAPWIFMYAVKIFGNKKQSKIAKREINKANREMAKHRKNNPQPKVPLGARL